MSKKCGAPKGNQNALKHGMYAHACTRDEQREISQNMLDYRQNNIKFCKVRISRIAEMIRPSASNPISFQENLLALRTLILILLRLHSAVSLKLQISNGREKDEEKEMIEFCQRIGMTQAEIDQELFGIVPLRIDGRKRGGQPGNFNSLKHGFFASAYTLEELHKLEDVNEDELIEEIALLQILMKRVFIGMRADIPLSDYLRADQVLSYADACLERLNRTKGLNFGPSAAIDRAYRELAILDPFVDHD